MEISVLAENEDWIVADKAAGMVVERNPYERDTVEHFVERYLSNNALNKMSFVGIVHRLDRVTSGAILFAKNRNSLKVFNEQMRLKRIRKTYLALVENLPAEKSATLEHHLLKDHKQKKAFIFDKAQKGTVSSILSYRLLSSNDKGYLLEVRLQTGRFHQIRAQLAHIGCPIVGDEKYGSSIKYQALSICLHAWKLSFSDPKTKEKIQLIAPKPQDEFWKK